MPTLKEVFNEFSSAQKLVVAILLWIGCLGFATLLIQNIHQLLDVHKVGNDVSALNSYDISIMRYTQILSTILGFLLPSLLFGMLATARPLRYFRKIPDFDLKWLFFSVLLILTIYPLVGFLAEINGKIQLPEAWSDLEKELINLEKLAKDYVIVFMNNKHSSVFIINLFMIAIVPAICEEFFFRGVIQRVSYRLFGNFHLAILFSAFFFAFSHFEFYTFLPRIVLGLLLGYMYYYSGSLFMPIFTHFLNNAVAVIALYINVLKGTPITMDTQDSVPIYVVFISTISFVGIYFFFVQSVLVFREKYRKKL